MKNNIGHFLAKQAMLNPTREALFDVTTGDRFTYAELNARTNRFANAASAAGISKGDRVATLLMNGHEFAELFFGNAKIGAVTVALNWRLVPDELAFILTDAGAETLIFGTPFNDAVSELHQRGADATAITRWIHVGDAAERPEFAESFADMMAAAAETEPQIVGEDDDQLFIMYTSGTTGLPKGAVHTHSTTMWAMITGAATAEMRKGDRYLICLPLFHVGALNPLLTTMYIGGTAIIMSEFDPVKIWELFGSEKVDCTLAVPAMLQFMLLTWDKENHDTSALRWIMSGASPVPANLIETYAGMGIEIHQVYGLTETGGPACLIGPDDAIRRAGSTGRAFFHTDVKVVGEDGAETAPNEPGEVLVRGPHLMTGYWNRPEATAETIVDGWLKTGDIAIVDDEGFVYIQDRVKDMIISGGENVYPAEIENVIVGLDGVKETAVIGIPSPKWGESPLAVVVKADDALTAEHVLSVCQEKLAKFKQPVKVEFIDAIPRNPTGKPLKRILREQFPQ